MSTTTIPSDWERSLQLLVGVACWVVDPTGQPDMSTLCVRSPLGHEFVNPLIVQHLTETVCERRLPSIVEQRLENSVDDYQILAIPVINQRQVQSILCLICRDDPAYGIAIENWKPAAGRSELILESGYYGRLRQFRKVSLAAHFLYGVGLPGRAWKQRQPIILHPLTGQQGFLRAKDARQEGLEFGIAIPVLQTHLELSGVLLLLTTAAVSFTDQCQVWNETECGLQMEKSYPEANWQEASARLPLEVKQVVELAFAEKRSVIQAIEIANPAAGQADVTVCVLPILRNRGSRSALVFLLQ